VRLTLILSAVIAALFFSQAACLIALGRRDAQIRTLEAAVTTCNDARRADQTTARELGLRDATVAGEAARACGIEGNDAFNRGVSVGRAVCEARR
jgi:hypothetical protein